MGNFFLVLFLMIFFCNINVKQTAKFIRFISCIEKVNLFVGVGLMVLATIFVCLQSKIPKIDPDKEIDKLYKSMISDKELFNRLNQILAKSPDKNLAINILISDSKYDSKLNKPKLNKPKLLNRLKLGKEFILYMFKTAAITLIGPFFILLIKWILKNPTLFIIILCTIIYFIIMLCIMYSAYKEVYINILDLEKYTLELYIKDYVTGYITCHWKVVKDGRV